MDGVGTEAVRVAVTVVMKVSVMVWVLLWMLELMAVTEETEVMEEMDVTD